MITKYAALVQLPNARTCRLEEPGVSIGLRVLLLIDSLILAGAEALVKDIAPRLRARGIQVSVAVLKELDSPFERELRAQGIPFLPTARGGIYSPLHIFSLAHEIRQFNLLHVFLFPAQLFAPLAALLARQDVPIIYSEQTTHHNREKPWLMPLDRWMYHRYRAVVCATDDIAQHLAQRHRDIRGRMTVVPNGIDLQRFREAEPSQRTRIVADPRAPVLIYTARLEPQKDHATLLQALACVPRAHLLLAGDGSLRSQTEALAQKLAVEHRVHFLGRRSDIPQLLKMADIYVHVPRFEGFGIAVIEAMAAGKAIIAADVPGLSEVVGDAGVLVAPENPAALAAAINALLASPDKQRDLSRASLARAELFDIERTVDRFITVYESVLAARPGENR